MSPINPVPSSSPRRLSSDNYHEPYQNRISLTPNQQLEMIEQLKKEKDQYTKSRHNITSNINSVNQNNISLKEAINDRKALYEEVINRYNLSIKKLLSAQNNNEKITKIFKS